MSTHPAAAGRADRIRRWRFWTATCTALAAAVALAVGVSTPPHSGPGCVSGCLAYPYTDAARYVPGDFWWLYPASLTALLAVVILAILANRRSPDARIAGWLGRALSVIAAAILVTDYAIQLTVVQPGLLTGQTDGLVLLTQYNPLGVFIALENVGYLLLGIAFVAAGTAMAARTRTERAARVVFLVGGSVTAAALAVLAAVYRADLGYRFEIVGISVDWLVLVIAGALLAAAARRPRHQRVTTAAVATTPTQESRRSPHPVA